MWYEDVHLSTRRYTNENGITVVNFILAYKRNHLNKEGETETIFVLWGNTAEVLAKYVHKGNLIVVHEELQNRNFDDRQKAIRYVTSVFVGILNFGRGKRLVKKTKI